MVPAFAAEMTTWQWFLAAIATASLAVITGIVLLLLTAHHPRPAFAEELKYMQAAAQQGTLEAQMFEDENEATIDMSVVIPAYNEQERISDMLQDCVSYVAATYAPEQWEILVVNDGSTDETTKTVLHWAQSHAAASQVRVCELVANRGKGGAVKHGMLHARGKVIVFADADGASRFSDAGVLLGKLRECERNGQAVAVGSRAHMVNTDAVVKRSMVRNAMMHGFHAFLRIMGVGNIADTQCGFKMFTHASARQIFSSMHVEGWIFDIEVLLLAEMLGIPVTEVPVTWHEVAGSKIALLQDSLRMARDLVVIRLNYGLGIWKVRSQEHGKPTSQ